MTPMTHITEKQYVISKSSVIAWTGSRFHVAWLHWLMTSKIQNLLLIDLAIFRKLSSTVNWLRDLLILVKLFNITFIISISEKMQLLSNSCLPRFRKANYFYIIIWTKTWADLFQFVIHFLCTWESRCPVHYEEHTSPYP